MMNMQDILPVSIAGCDAGCTIKGDGIENPTFEVDTQTTLAHAPVSVTLLYDLSNDVLDMIVLQPALSRSETTALTCACPALRRKLWAVQCADKAFENACRVEDCSSFERALHGIDALPFPYQRTPILRLIRSIACIKDGASEIAYEAVFIKVRTFPSAQQGVFLRLLFQTSEFIVPRKEAAYAACLDATLELEQAQRAALLCVLAENAFKFRHPKWQGAFFERLLLAVEGLPIEERGAPLAVLLAAVWTLAETERMPALIATLRSLRLLLEGPRPDIGRWDQAMEDLDKHLQWLQSQTNMNLRRIHRIVFQSLELSQRKMKAQNVLLKLNAIPDLDCFVNKEMQYETMMSGVMRLPDALRHRALGRLCAFASVQEGWLKSRMYQAISAEAVRTGFDPYPVLTQLFSPLQSWPQHEFHDVLDTVLEAASRCSRDFSLLNFLCHKMSGVADRHIDYFVDRMLQVMMELSPFFRRPVYDMLEEIGRESLPLLSRRRVLRRLADARMALLPEVLADCARRSDSAASSSKMENLHSEVVYEPVRSLHDIDDYVAIREYPVAQRGNLLRLLLGRDGMGAMIRTHFLDFYKESISTLPEDRRAVPLEALIRSVFFLEDMVARCAAFDEILRAYRHIATTSQHQVLAALLDLVCELPSGEVMERLTAVLRLMAPLLNEKEGVALNGHLRAIAGSKLAGRKDTFHAVLIASAGLAPEYRGKVLARWMQEMPNAYMHGADVCVLVKGFIAASEVLPGLARNRVLLAAAAICPSLSPATALRVHGDVLAAVRRTEGPPDGGVLMLAAANLGRAICSAGNVEVDRFFGVLDDVPYLDYPLIQSIALNIAEIHDAEHMSYFLIRLLASISTSLPASYFHITLTMLRQEASEAQTPALTSLARQHINHAADKLVSGGRATLG